MPAATRILLRPDLPFNGVQLFTATMAAQRQGLGDQVTEWLTRHSHVTATEMLVTQSSSEEFHCLAIWVFFWEPVP
jgi:hypothetical protein